MSIEPPLKKKYLHGHKSTFKSSTSSSGSSSKRLLRADKSAIHRPAKAKWAKHLSGSWWGGKNKDKHAG